MRAKTTWLCASAILVLSILTLSQVLFKEGIAFYGDYSFPVSTERFAEVFLMWNPYSSYSFGFQSSMPLMFMLPFLFSIRFFNLSIEGLSKLMLLAGLFLSGLSMFLASREILKKHKRGKQIEIDFVSLIAAIVYMFNPWAMDRVGHYFLWISYAFAPLVLLLAMKLTDGNKINYKLVLLTALVLVVGSTWPFGIFANMFLLFSWILYSVFLAIMSRQPRKAIFSLKVLTITFVLYLLFSAHWILPYAASSLTQTIKPQYIVSLEMVEMLSSRSNYSNVLRLIGYWWPLVQYWPNPPFNVMWTFASILLPLSAIGTIFFKRNKYEMYLFLVCVASVIISTGPRIPFTQMYSWGLFYSPFSNALGWVFRDPNKWNALTALAYSFQVGIFFFEVFSRLSNSRNTNSLSNFRYLRKYAKPVLIVFLMVISITLYMSPAVLGYFTQIYTPENIPQEYYNANDWLRQRNDDSRVLWLAPLSNGTPIAGFIRYSWAPDKPYTEVIDSWSSGKPSMALVTYEARRYINFVYESIKEPYWTEYLLLLGVRYVLYHNDILGAETQGHQDIVNLMNQSELELVWHEGFIYIFQVHSYMPRISAQQNALLVVGWLDSLHSLHSIPSFSFRDTAVLFLEQRFYDTSILNLTKYVAIVNKDVSDLAFSFLDAGYVVAPFGYTIHSNPYEEWAKTNVYEDWWTAPAPTTLSGYWDWDYGLGLVKTTASNAKLAIDYASTFSGTHNIWVRCYESLAGGRISLSVSGTEIAEIDTVGERGFIWRKIGTASLNEGKHSIVLENIYGFNAVNIVALVPTFVEDKLFNLTKSFNITYISSPPNTGTEQQFTKTEGTVYPWLKNNATVNTNESPISITYTQVSASEWMVNVNTSRPFMLGLTESYDSLWSASDSLSTKSMPLYSVINGFFIDKTGSYMLFIRYEPQFFFDMGLDIMAASFTVSTFLVAVSLEREKHPVSNIISRTLSWMHERRSSTSTLNRKKRWQ